MNAERTLVSVAASVRQLRAYVADTLEKLEEPTEADPIYNWISRAAYAEAALEIVLAHLGTILEDVAPVRVHKGG